jgi:DNA-binding CsgD family transcriptional regulator
LFEPEDRVRAQEALRALADGTIDFYRTHRHLRSENSPHSEVSIWVHAIDFGPRHYALSEVCRSEELRISPLIQYLGYTPTRFAIGIVDGEGIITSISSNAQSVIGIPPDKLIGLPLLRESSHSFWSRLHEGVPEGGPCLVSWPQSSLHSQEQLEPVTCLLACLTGTDANCFLFIREEKELERERTNRETQLERHLWKIAEEVRASGILTSMPGEPDLHTFPQLGSLSTRQWEVLTRLLRGERVGTIASGLFISPSTVRNNLSAIFTKFGVHSQSELLNLLQH